MNQNLSVHLRVYRGKKLSYNEYGVAQNENYTVKLQYDTKEYYKFVELLRTNGYVKVDVERVLDLTKKDEETKYGYAEVSGAKLKGIQEEISKAFAVPLPNQTPEQKQIAELRQMIEDLKASGNVVAEPGTNIEAPAPLATAIAPDAGLVTPEDIAAGTPAGSIDATATTKPTTGKKAEEQKPAR